MRTQLLYFLIILSGFTVEDNKPNVTRWVTINGCSLKVDGSTNINNFSCTITNYSKPDTIHVTRTGNEPVTLNGNIKLAVQDFDCHNPMMTADLRKTLKVKTYPNVVVRLISINKYPEVNKPDITKGTVAIELAGVSRRFEVNYKVLPSERIYINLVGSRKINFSDFNIIPPRKLGGMIQTNNELSVEFNLRMKVLD